MFDLEDEGKARARQARITIRSTRPLGVSIYTKEIREGALRGSGLQCNVMGAGIRQGSRIAHERKSKPLTYSLSPRYTRWRSVRVCAREHQRPAGTQGGRGAGGERRTGVSPTPPPQPPSTRAAAPACFEVEASRAPRPEKHQSSASAQDTRRARSGEAGRHIWGWWGSH